RLPSARLAPSTTLFRSLRLEETHRGLVDQQRALDPAAAEVGHPAPVAVALADQRPGRDGADRLVPVLHLDRVQADVDHVAVGVRSEEHTSELQSRENLV